MYQRGGVWLFPSMSDCSFLLPVLLQLLSLLLFLCATKKHMLVRVFVWLSEHI